MTITLDSVLQLTLNPKLETPCTPLLTIPGTCAFQIGGSGSCQPQQTDVMPFLAEEHIDIPTTDLLSWMFDQQSYDADEPVNVLGLSSKNSFTEHHRFTLMQQSLSDLFHQDRLEV